MQYICILKVLSFFNLYKVSFVIPGNDSIYTERNMYDDWGYKRVVRKIHRNIIFMVNVGIFMAKMAIIVVII